MSRPFYKICFLLLCLVTATGLRALADTVDNYQIHLRDKVVVREVGDKFLQLDESDRNETIRINYNHCVPYRGDRRLFVKDADGKILWQRLFTGNDGAYQMEVPVTDWLTCGDETSRPARLLYLEEGSTDSIRLAILQVEYVEKGQQDMSVFNHEFGMPVKILISTCLASFVVLIVVMRVKALRNGRNKKTL